MNPEAPPIDWFPLLVLAASALVMLYLIRRSMRGMNQQDWVLLRQTRSRGIDLQQPQAVNFIVFAASEETAAELAERMRHEGFETSIKEAQIQFARNRNKPGAPQEGWLVSGSRLVRLVPETLTAIRKTLTELATERKALYLGWQLAEQRATNQPAPGTGEGTQSPAPDRPPP